MELEWTMNIGNLATAFLAIVGFVVGWVKMSERSQANRTSILSLRSVVEAKADKDEIRHLRADLDSRVSAMQFSHDKSQSSIADSLKSIAVEMRAMHAEYASFREHVAARHPTRSVVDNMFGTLRADIKDLVRRIDGRRNGTA